MSLTAEAFQLFNQSNYQFELFNREVFPFTTSCFSKFYWYQSTLVFTVIKKLTFCIIMKKYLI